MTAPASAGAQSRLSMAQAGTSIASYTEIYAFESEDLKKTQNLIDDTGISGTRSHRIERQRDGTYTVGGGIKFRASPTMLGNGNSTAQCVLSRIMGGGAPSANVWSLGETLPFFDVLVDRINKRWQYQNCVINRATFRARANGPLECDLDIIGETETTSATAFPSLANATDPPYIWTDTSSAFTIQSIACVATDFELVIDNHCQARFSNSISATDILTTDRTISLRATIPWTSDYSTEYGVNTANSAAASLVFTNGSHVLTFTFGTYSVPDHSPVVQNKGEIFLKLDGVVKMTGSTRELVVTSTT